MLFSHGGGAVLTVLFCLARQGLADAGNSCTDSPKSSAHRLRHELFCNYDRKERPTKHEKNKTEIYVHQLLLSFYLNDRKNTIDVSSWMTWQWNDEHLIWNKDTYEDIKQIIVTSDDIWVPDIGSYDVAGKLQYLLTDVHCLLNNTGSLTCSSPALISSECDVDIEEWPYDMHSCIASIGPWSYTGEQVSLTLLRDGISTKEYVPDKTWKLLNATAKVDQMEIDNETYIWIEYIYELESYHGGHVAVVVPSFVLALVTLAAYATEPQSRERLVIIGLNLISHCFFLTFLGANLNYNGESVPFIVLFFRDSLLVVTMSLVTSLLSRKMLLTCSSPPDWVMTLSSCLLASTPAHVILYDKLKGMTKVGDAIEGWPESEIWRLLGILLDRFSFIITLLCSFVLYLVYVLYREHNLADFN